MTGGNSGFAAALPKCRHPVAVAIGCHAAPAPAVRVFAFSAGPHVTLKNAQKFTLADYPRSILNGVPIGDILQL